MSSRKVGVVLWFTACHGLAWFSLLAIGGGGDQQFAKHDHKDVSVCIHSGPQIMCHGLGASHRATACLFALTHLSLCRLSGAQPSEPPPAAAVLDVKAQAQEAAAGMLGQGSGMQHVKALWVGGSRCMQHIASRLQ